MKMQADVEGVLNHLLFHKALIDDGQEDQRVERYLEILSEAEEGETLPDPVDESIRAVFHLVLNQGFDPWDIDLMEFTRLYAEKIEAEGVDLIVAGRLVHMAWSVLRLQSEETLLENDREEDLFFFDWELDGFMDVEEEPLLRPPSDLLKATPQRAPTRPVSLMELLDAFEDARREAEVVKAREQRRRQMRAKPDRPFNNNAHDEDLERDVESTWERVQMIGAGPIALSDLFLETRNENLSIFLAVLFLVRDGRLALWQDDLPRGEIYLEIKMGWASGKVEDAPQAEIRNRMTVI